MKRPADDETTGVFRTRIAAAFERHDAAYRPVGESTARWLAEVQGRPVVLVVEDQRQLQLSYAEALGDGCVVLLASDEPEALGHLDRAQRVDLAILDLLLPVGDGFAVAAALRLKYPRVPVLVVSAYLDPMARQRLVALGGPFEFHPKPETDVAEWAKRHLTPA